MVRDLVSQLQRQIAKIERHAGHECVPGRRGAVRSSGTLRPPILRPRGAVGRLLCMTGIRDRFRRRPDAAGPPAAPDQAPPGAPSTPGPAASVAPAASPTPFAGPPTVGRAPAAAGGAAPTAAIPVVTPAPATPTVAAPTPATAPSPDTPAPAAPEPEEAGFATRGKLRRRLRYLRRVRELGYRDLGGLIFDQHRFGRANEALVQGKVAALTQIDGEVRALEGALHDHRQVAELREAGIGACSRCGAIHGSEARYCPACGLSLTGPTELSTMPVATSSPTSGPVPPGAMAPPAQRAPAAQPTSLFQQPTPAAAAPAAPPTPPPAAPSPSPPAEQPTTILRAADVGSAPVSTPAPIAPEVTSGDPLAPGRPPAERADS